MKKAFKLIRNIVLGVIMFVYFIFIIFVSTLLLNKNDYGVTQFGDKALILVDGKTSNSDYKEGSLVVVQETFMKDLKVGDEVFIYRLDEKKKTVDIVISDVAEIHLDVSSPYITLANDGTAWGQDFIAGVAHKTYEDLGGFLNFMQSKWVFFALLIVPCFFILLYEIYMLIISIKYDDEEEAEVTNNVSSSVESTADDKVAELERQLAELKKAREEETKEKDEVQELADKLAELQKEYDEIDNPKVEEVKDATIELPILASIDNDKEDVITNIVEEHTSKIQIIKEEEGNKLDKEKTLQTVKKAILNLEPKVNLMDDDCYEHPSVRSDDVTLQEQLKTLNQYVNTKITYEFGDNKEYKCYCSR